MLELPLILLQRNDDNGPMRFLGILVIVAIFIIGNLIQWLQKYQEQKRKQELQRRAQGLPEPTRRPMPGKPSPRPRQTAQPRRPAPPQRTAPSPAQRKPQAPPRLPPLPQPAQPTRPARPAQAARQVEMPPPGRGTGPDISASEIGAAVRQETTDKRTEFLRAVLNRHSLRNAYILTEILQPPVALRDSTTPEP